MTIRKYTQVNCAYFDTSYALRRGSSFDKCNNGKELNLLIKESIETYNSKRPHLSLNMKTPNFVHNKKSSKDNFTGFI
jgi:transposase InsO family protein